MKNYIAILHKESDSDFGVSFPDFPGCITAGKTLAEAQEMAVEALAIHIEGMKEDGEAIPAPSSLDDLAADPDLLSDGGVAILVPFNPPSKTVRFNLTALDTQLEAIDLAAERAGMNRSAFMVSRALEAPDSKRIFLHKQIAGKVFTSNGRRAKGQLKPLNKTGR